MADNAWKIADFGFTSKGTSKYAYTTEHARGTQSYRAPELVRERSIVTQNSDIWALGCILYELAFSRKAFPRDYSVFEYIHSKTKLELHDLPGSERLRCYIRELISCMLEIDWWRRPSAKDVRRALDFLLEGTTAICVVHTGKEELLDAEAVITLNLDGRSDLPAASVKPVRPEFLGEPLLELPKKIRLDDTNPAWAKTEWKPCWYFIYVASLTLLVTVATSSLKAERPHQIQIQKSSDMIVTVQESSSPILVGSLCWTRHILKTHSSRQHTPPFLSHKLQLSLLAASCPPPLSRNRVAQSAQVSKNKNTSLTKRRI